MRKILLTTFGSYGDLHPYLAMARVLINHGDQVSIATHTEYQEYVERIGATFVAIKPGLDELGPRDGWAAEANHSIRGTEFIVRTLILPYLEDCYQAIRGAAVGHDLIISHVLSFATPVVAEELGIPWVSAVLQPAVFFSGYDPPVLGPVKFLPKLKFLGPRFLRWLMFFLAGHTGRWLTPIADLRAKSGLRPDPKNVLLESCSPFGTIALFPAAFAPPQPDWPVSVKQIGFPLFDEETTSELSPDLEQFLAAGPPPVVFTLGTAVSMMHTPYFELAYQAVKQLGLRAVFLAGKELRGVPEAAKTDSSIHISTYEPFSKIFPRAAAIAHQCGIGTTAQALASGRPQMLVPFAHDQPDNARRVVAMGAGTSIPSGRLNVSRLLAAIKAATQSNEVINRAQQVAPEVNDGAFAQRFLDAAGEIIGQHRSR